MGRRPLALAACAVLAGCAHPVAAPSGYFQPTAAQLGPELNGYGEAVLPHGALIAVQGDDLAYGVGLRGGRNRINGAAQGQAAATISESLRRVLGRAAEVENRGFPGDTVQRSARRWAAARPCRLLILAFGFGDQKAHTTTDAFAAGLRALIRAAHAQGAAVFVVTPPAVANTLLNANLQPYRGTAEAVAQQEGAEVFAAAASMASAKEPPASGAPQSARSYRVIAGAMAPYVKVLPME